MYLKLPLSPAHTIRHEAINARPFVDMEIHEPAAVVAVVARLHPFEKHHAHRGGKAMGDDCFPPASPPGSNF